MSLTDFFKQIYASRTSANGSQPAIGSDQSQSRANGGPKHAENPGHNPNPAGRVHGDVIAKQPATAREMYAQRDAQQKANQNPVSPDVRALADRVTATLDKSTIHIQPHPSPSPSDVGSHSEPMRQKAMNQDKVAPALSPTTEQVGKAADKAQSVPTNPARSAGLHNRATPDEIITSERAPSSSPEMANAKQQTAPARSPQKQRSGWDRSR